MLSSVKNKSAWWEEYLSTQVTYVLSSKRTGHLKKEVPGYFATASE